jgi:uncharacterized protein YacL
MSKIPLTEEEILKLKGEIEFSISDRKKRMLDGLVYLTLGIFIGLIVNYLRSGGLVNVALFISSFILFIIMLIPFLGAYLLTQKRINKLRTDLKKEIKIVGKEKIESINIFNRTIKLSNGVKVFEPNEYYKTFKKGDLINFKVSPSNAYIFECLKE